MTVSLTTHQQLRTWAEEFAALATPECVEWRLRPTSPTHWAEGNSWPPVDGRDRSCW
jgi:hypothetical protein